MSKDTDIPAASIQQVPLSRIKANPSNPRVLHTENCDKLVSDKQLSTALYNIGATSDAAQG